MRKLKITVAGVEFNMTPVGKDGLFPWERKAKKEAKKLKGSKK